jgi:hypothetical protein
LVQTKRKLAVLGAAGGVLTLGAAVLGGVVMAQTPGSGSGSGTTSAASPTPSAAQQQRQAQQQAERDQYLNDLAKNLGVDRSKLDSALKQTAKDQVAAALQAGTLTQSEATAADQAIDSGNAPGGPGFGPGFGIGSNIGDRFGIQQVTGLQDAIDKAFQQTVGETRQQFFQEVQGGKTPAQVFQAHNTTAQAVAQAEVNAAKPLLDQAVQQQKITQAQETDFLQHLQNGGPGGPGGHGPGGRPPGPPPSGGTTSNP